jgi:3-methylfumaryl-CoA hydratase
VPLPRRMWAGGALEFREPLRVGDAVERESRIADVAVKEGRTGHCQLGGLQGARHRAAVRR